MENRSDDLSKNRDELQLSLHKNDIEDVSTLSECSDEIATFDNYQQNNGLPLANNFSDIDLSTCTNVQIGTRIITSNLTLIEPTKSVFEEMKNKITKGSNSEKLAGDGVIYCHITSKTCFTNLWVKIIFLTILVFTLSLAFTEIFHQGKAATGDDVTQTNSIYETTQIPRVYYNASWLVSREEWGAQSAVKCKKNLKTTNQVKIMMTYLHCNSFMVCQKSIQSKQNESLVRGDDLYFHFGISENGIIYEGLSTNCETRPAYRNCNETFLVILIFFGSNICLETDEVEKQIKSFNKIIQYNQNEGILSNDSIKINLLNRCFEKYYTQLNETYSDIYRYYQDIEYSC